MISVDTPEDNKKFAESLDSDFPLLSTPTKEVAEAYGVVTAERGLCGAFNTNIVRAVRARARS